MDGYIGRLVGEEGGHRGYGEGVGKEGLQEKELAGSDVHYCASMRT
jgi:hypothetical protein